MHAEKYLFDPASAKNLSLYQETAKGALLNGKSHMIILLQQALQ
jgi:hypothetical protein